MSRRIEIRAAEKLARAQADAVSLRYSSDIEPGLRRRPTASIFAASTATVRRSRIWRYSRGLPISRFHPRIPMCGFANPRAAICRRPDATRLDASNTAVTRVGATCATATNLRVWSSSPSGCRNCGDACNTTRKASAWAATLWSSGDQLTGRVGNSKMKSDPPPSRGS